MALTSQASPDETSSPFYKRNMEICLEWEKLIKSKGGVVNGGYSAWAYKIVGEIQQAFKWEIEVSKSTYSNLRKHSFDDMFVFEDFKLSTTINNSNSPDFIIRKRNFLDLFKSNSVNLSRNNQYVIIGTSELLDFPKMIIDLIHSPLEKNKVYSVGFENNRLEIAIHSFDEGISFISRLTAEKTKPNTR